MTADVVIAALNLPASARVDQRVPKKLLLENAAPTAADKRLINEGLDGIQWLSALKPATCGVPALRDATREYLEIAVLRLTLRAGAKTERLIELAHRAVPYPVLLLIDHGDTVAVSLAHKRQALKEADKVVLDGDPVTAAMQPADSVIYADFLHALDLTRQPRTTLYALYQGWVDTVLALQASVMTGRFYLLDTVERVAARRQALDASHHLQGQIASLRNAAGKTSQMARQVEFNLEIKRLQAALAAAHAQL